MDEFRPDLVLISAGFDSRIGDPLGRFVLTDTDFADLTAVMLEIARQARRWQADFSARRRIRPERPVARRVRACAIACLWQAICNRNDGGLNK